MEARWRTAGLFVLSLAGALGLCGCGPGHRAEDLYCDRVVEMRRRVARTLAQQRDYIERKARGGGEDEDKRAACVVATRAMSRLTGQLEGLSGTAELLFRMAGGAVHQPAAGAYRLGGVQRPLRNAIPDIYDACHQMHWNRTLELTHHAEAMVVRGLNRNLRGCRNAGWTSPID